MGGRCKERDAVGTVGKEIRWGMRRLVGDKRVENK